MLYKKSKACTERSLSSLSFSRGENACTENLPLSHSVFWGQRISRMSTILTWTFLISKHVSRTSTSSHCLCRGQNVFTGCLPSSCSSSQSQTHVSNVYQPHTALPDIEAWVITEVKTLVANMYDPHTAFPGVKTCSHSGSQNLCTESLQSLSWCQKAFPACIPSFSRSQNMCTEHLPSLHSLSWGQNALLERLPSRLTQLFRKG